MYQERKQQNSPPCERLVPSGEQTLALCPCADHFPKAGNSPLPPAFRHPRYSFHSWLSTTNPKLPHCTLPTWPLHCTKGQSCFFPVPGQRRPKTSPVPRPRPWRGRSLPSGLFSRRKSARWSCPWPPWARRGRARRRRRERGRRSSSGEGRPPPERAAQRGPRTRPACPRSTPSSARCSPTCLPVGCVSFFRLLFHR
jgi:hypothetical protein